MARFALKVEFNGTKFCGSQIQPNGRTVQGELQKSLSTYFREPVSVILASRVDSGVHARGMVGHFEISDSHQPNLRQACYSLNCLLPPDAAITDLRPVPRNFHSRRDAQWRSYIYRVRCLSPRRPLEDPFTTYVHHALSLSTLNEMSSLICGQHDFTGLSQSNSNDRSNDCFVSSCLWEQPEDRLFKFVITADRFVYKMVRTIVGSQFDVLSGKISTQDYSSAFKLKQRERAGSPAPSRGLCLESITYKLNPFSPISNSDDQNQTRISR